MPDPDEHIDWETLEIYALGRADTATAMTIEAHVALCPECAEALRDADDFVRALRAVMLEGPDKGPAGWWRRLLALWRRISSGS